MPHPCGAVVVPVATPPDHVSVVKASEGARIAVRSAMLVSSVNVPGAVVVPPTETNAPVRWSFDGVGGTCWATARVTMLLVMSSFSAPFQA